MLPSPTANGSTMLCWSVRLASASRHWPMFSLRRWRPTCTKYLGSRSRQPADLNALLLEAKDKDVIHIDEAMKWAKQYQTALYLALDKRKVFLNGGGKGRSPRSMPVADFTLLLSTTDEYCLLQPLRDRMKLTLRFEFYSADELAQVVSSAVERFAGMSMNECSRQSPNGRKAHHDWLFDCFNRAGESVVPKVPRRSPSNTWNVLVRWSGSTL